MWVVVMVVEAQITSKLREAFQPIYLEVVNESHGHNVPSGSETHFKVVLVSQAFDGVGRLERHRRIYGVLASELAGGVHALTLACYTPSEWSDRAGVVPQSPECMGGQKQRVGMDAK